MCGNAGAEEAAAFDVRLLLSTRLDVEINGFNGGLLDGVLNAYKFYLSLYGVKWPEGYQLEVGDNHDASEGFNLWHLERAISEMKQGGDV